MLTTPEVWNGISVNQVVLLLGCLKTSWKSRPAVHLVDGGRRQRIIVIERLQNMKPGAIFVVDVPPLPHE